jgi:hypothetical protein
MRREAFDSTQAAKKRQSADYYLQNFDTRKECMTEIGRMLLVPPLNLQAHQGWNYPMPRRPTVVTELTQPSISQSADLSSPDPNKDPVSNPDLNLNSMEWSAPAVANRGGQYAQSRIVGNQRRVTKSL